MRRFLFDQSKKNYRSKKNHRSKKNYRSKENRFSQIGNPEWARISRKRQVLCPEHADSGGDGPPFGNPKGCPCDFSKRRPGMGQNIKKTTGFYKASGSGTR